MKKNTKFFLKILTIVILLVALFFTCFSSDSESPIQEGCVQGGEITFDLTNGEFIGFCCEGLQEVVALPDGTNEECLEYEQMDRFGTICTDCGNNICEKWENRCICPEDCS